MPYPTTYDAGGVAPWIIESGEAGSGTALALTANTTYIVAFTVHATVTIPLMRYRANVASGNIDMGIYDPVSGNLLGHTGITTVVNTLNSVNLIAAITLGPGRYYMAFWIDNATATIFSISTQLEKMSTAGISGSTNTGGLAATLAGMGGVVTPASTKVIMAATVVGGL